MLSFSEALPLAKEGFRVSREGWNGKGMWIALYEGPWELTFGDTEDSPSSAESDETFHGLPFLVMKTADGKIVPWLASQTDILAEDWNLFY